VDRDPDQGSKTSAVPCGSVFGSWSDFEIKKMNFYMKNVLEVENSSKNYKGTTAFLKGRKPGLFDNFGQF
jgi:hypothetical protein